MRLSILIPLLLALPLTARAVVIELPRSLAEETLSQTVPLVLFSPNGYRAADYAVEWIGAPIPGVSVSLGEKSLQWVRILDVLLIPRGRILLQAENAEGGQLSAGSFTQPLAIEAGRASAELPVALISGDRNPVQVTLKRDGRELKGALQIRFRPRAETQEKLRRGERVILDSSCSPHRVELDPATLEIPSDTWAYVGCRLSHVKGDRRRTASLELLVFWDGVGQSAEIGGVATQPYTPSLWPLRLRSKPGVARMKAREHELVFRYSIPENLYIFGIGAGIGPYAYDYYSPSVETHAYTLLPTLYGSYYFDETMRVVGFGAGAIHSDYYADVGLYLVTEQVRALDERLSLNVMLGAHVLGFRGTEGHAWAFSAPQGAEVVYRDFLLTGWNATLGSFVYPPIDGRSYYNLWLRYGTNRWFAELNYIGWQEPVEDGHIRSRSVGVSVGVPFLLKIL